MRITAQDDTPSMEDQFGSPESEAMEAVARHVDWLESYAHDLMEEGDFDQEADRLNAAASALASYAAENERLTRERDEARKAVSNVAAAWGREADLEDAEKRLEAAAAKERRLRKALGRQCDNMVFVINHVYLGKWIDKLIDELGDDRAALADREGRE